MIVQWSVESGWGHLAVGTVPSVAVFQLVPEVVDLLWCGLLLTLEQLWLLGKTQFLKKNQCK